jgi:hypothetical protein
MENNKSHSIHVGTHACMECDPWQFFDFIFPSLNIWVIDYLPSLYKVIRTYTWLIVLSLISREAVVSATLLTWFKRAREVTPPLLSPIVQCKRQKTAAFIKTRSPCTSQRHATSELSAVAVQQMPPCCLSHLIKFHYQHRRCYIHVEGPVRGRLAATLVRTLLPHLCPHRISHPCAPHAHGNTWVRT